MDIDFLLSFKNHPPFQNLSEECIKKFGSLIKPNKKGKNKKAKINDNKKASTFIKEKIQISKDKIDNKFSLLVNKLDSNNINKIIEEFIDKFRDINESEYLIFQKYIYTRILKDNKFIDIYLDFFIKINMIFNRIFNYNQKHFISLIELKFKYDYDINKELSYNELKVSDLEELKLLNSEENRINNIDLIIKFIENGLLDVSIIDEVVNSLINTDFIPDIHRFLSNKFIKEKIDLKSYYDTLKSKSENKLDNRYRIILDSILEKYDNNYSSKENSRSDSITSVDNIESEINYEIDLKTVESFEKLKSKIEIEIENIIEEYLLIEDFEEINNYLENHDNANNFMVELINHYFKNNLNNFDKFKSLFLNFRNNQIINSNIIIESLIGILNSDNIFDYVNVETKTKKLLDIFKILQINLDKEQDQTIRKVITS
tara:strand:- start:7976 stop:9265 length:1290 start_codon:yes stop_codon:yes gene_type:complete